MLQNLYYLILLLLGFPAGLLLAWLCKDEIKKWRGRMFLISVLSLVLIIILSFLSFEFYLYKIPTIISLFFIIIVCLTINWKSN